MLDGVAHLTAQPGTSTNGDGTRPLRVFEPACGEGFLAAALLRVARERKIELRYSGADLSEAAVELARPTLGDVVVVGEAAEATSRLETGAADVVIVKNLLHHLEAPSEVLREAGRVVGPDGRVVIIEGRLGCPQFMLIAALAPKRERFYFLGTRRNRAAAAKAELSIVHRERFSFLPYELFFHIRPKVMRRLFATSDPAALDRYTRIDDGLARNLPWLASYWLWMAAPTGAAPDASAPASAEGTKSR